MDRMDKPQRGRTFTFVDYDINRRGVTDLARAHLMKDRVRLKREARTEWLSRNHCLPLRWMQSEEGNGGPEPDLATATATPKPNRQDKINRRSFSGCATVIDFRKSIGSSSSPTSISRSVSPNAKRGKRVDTPPNAETCQASPEQDPISRHISQALRALGDRLDLTGSPSGSGTDTTEIERLTAPPEPKRKPDSDFGQSPGSRIEDLQKPFSAPATPAPSNLSPELETWYEKRSVTLTPSDRNLIGYFAANADAILGVDQFPEIVQEYNPVLTLFIPFALSSQWCFETMVLLQSAYHHRQHARSVDSTVREAENRYLASRQNGILARTRSRISALAGDGDSCDEDVIAFLFLAVSEYGTGHRQLGLMHFQAWKEYCEMRRRLRIKPCGLPCRIVVWWCVSMLVGDDVPLDSFLSPTTMEWVREDPAKLFRYFAHHGHHDFEWAEEPMLSQLSRHNTW